MNIFYLDEDPRQCAEWMVDKHVVKMILETAQLLSTAHRIIDGTLTEVNYYVDGYDKVKNKKTWVLPDGRDEVFYRATHMNHPSAIWTRQSVENYNWLVEHLFALSDEYTYRYGKVHKTITKMGYDIQSPPHGLNEWDMTPMPSCMADEYIIGSDPVANYRNYYKLGKANIHSWKKREAPAWIL